MGRRGTARRDIQLNTGTDGWMVVREPIEHKKHPGRLWGTSGQGIKSPGPKSVCGSKTPLWTDRQTGRLLGQAAGAGPVSGLEVGLGQKLVGKLVSSPTLNSGVGAKWINGERGLSPLK